MFRHSSIASVTTHLRLQCFQYYRFAKHLLTKDLQQIVNVGIYSDTSKNVV